ncbi:MAG: CDP-alcohol phosphatidyltransferase family protein [Actinomycetes bacterium]
MNRAKFFDRWSSLHGNVEINGIVRGWLTISYAIVKPISLLKISASVVTLSGLGFAIALWLTSQHFWAIGFLALSLLCDGLDGSLAILTGSESLRGAVLDSIVDRLAEVFWALTFFAIGGHIEVVFLAWFMAGVQEYARARMGGVGIREIGVVSIAERPVRASLLAIALVANALSLDFVNQIAIIWLGMQTWSLLSVMRFAYNFTKKADESKD